MRGPGFIPTFLFYFVGTTLIVAMVVSSGIEPDVEVNAYQSGILFGVVAGLLGAYFNSHQIMTVPLKNRGATLKKFKETLTQMGYEETGQIDEFTVYSRPMPSSLLSGKLFVQTEKDSITISGRANKIRRLQKQMVSQ